MILDFTTSNFIEIPSLNADDARTVGDKGWSFSFVYDFSEIRDVFLALKSHPFKGLSDFFSYCNQIELPFAKTKWNSRRVLENLNALKNFGLISGDYVPIKDVFQNSKVGTPLTNEELDVFADIFFSYFRFKEMLSWFIDFSQAGKINYVSGLNKNQVINQSRAIFTFSEKGRFTDSFTYSLASDSDIYYIDPTKKSELIRFWDVFIKWGTSLNVLTKVNLKHLSVSTQNSKSIACIYIVNESPINIDLLSLIKTLYGSETYIYLPHLVLSIIVKYRIRVEQAHEIIIRFYKDFKEIASFERTSEIFIKKGRIRAEDNILFPRYNDSYISHLILRQ